MLPDYPIIRYPKPRRPNFVWKAVLLAAILVAASKLCRSQKILHLTQDTLAPTGQVLDFAGQTISFEGGHIRGNGIAKRFKIDADYDENIIDTSVILQDAKPRYRVFSNKWLGLDETAINNTPTLAKAIRYCLDWGIFNNFTPAGKYYMADSLLISTVRNGNYVASSIHFYGEGTEWMEKTIFVYTKNTGWAIGIQVGKGCIFEGFSIHGNYKPPSLTDSNFYASTFANYTDPNVSPLLTGFAIDPVGDAAHRSGSTQIVTRNVWIHNFTIAFSTGQSGWTDNGEILSYEYIRAHNCKIGFATSEPQEKCNTVTHFDSWGDMFELISIGRYGRRQAGNWLFQYGNIAGRAHHLIYAQVSGWFPSHISNYFCESIGAIGEVYSGLPFTISRSIFTLANPVVNGTRTIFTANNVSIRLSDNVIRYYGYDGTPIRMNGAATYENNTFSGPVIDATLLARFSGNGRAGDKPDYRLLVDSLQRQINVLKGPRQIFVTP